MKKIPQSPKAKGRKEDTKKKKTKGKRQDDKSQHV